MKRIYNKHRRGFTLVELLLSMSVATVLMAGLASAMVLASRAIPDPQSPLSSTVTAYHLAEEIASELYTARTFTERSPTVVDFTVADRDDDNTPETIRYEWTGTPGDPLTRQYNGGSIVSIAENVHEFDLTYLTRSTTETETVTTITTVDEAILDSFEGWSGIPSPSLGNVAVSSDIWAAEFFNLTALPDDVSKLTITRVDFQIRQGTLGDAGTISVAIHRTVGGGNPEPAKNPSGTPVTRSAAFLPSSFGWMGFTFADVTINNPNKEYVIVVKGSDPAGGDAEVLLYSDGSAPKDDSEAMWTTDGGKGWDPKKTTRDDNDFPFRVYGSYETTSVDEVEITRKFLQSVGITLRIGPQASTRVNTAVEVLNHPEVPSL